jgi:hypothetical protein
MDNTVKALTVYNGDLIAAGLFQNAGGQRAHYVARWDGSNWHPLASSINGSGSALVVFNGELIMGGVFRNIDGQTTNRVARWNGSQWRAMGSLGDPTVNESVDALAVAGGVLIVGGKFTSAEGRPANNVARWDGSAWQPLGTGLGRESLAVARPQRGRDRRRPVYHGRWRTGAAGRPLGRYPLAPGGRRTRRRRGVYDDSARRHPVRRWQFLGFRVADGSEDRSLGDPLTGRRRACPGAGPRAAAGQGAAAPAPGDATLTGSRIPPVAPGAVRSACGELPKSACRGSVGQRPVTTAPVFSGSKDHVLLAHGGCEPAITRCIPGEPD